jgi:maltooligosyltrehalose trehalohydrolase
MGEQNASKTPFLFFTDHNAELAQAVRDGRRREFSSFPQFSDQTLLAKLPDPNAVATFEQSRPHPDPAIGTSRLDLYRRLLDLRRTEIIPRLKGAKAIVARALGAAAVTASWRMADDRLLSIACNLGADEVELALPEGVLLFASSDLAASSVTTGRLAPYSTVATLGRA